MTITDAILVGMLGAGAIGLIAFLLYRAVRLAEKMMKSFSDAANSAMRAASAANAVAVELAYMRAMSGNQPVVVEPIREAPAGAQAPQPSGTPEYPPPFFDRFTPAPAAVAPDATMEDTDLDALNQTDAELSMIEQVEKLRDRGIVVEDDDVVHPGVEADAE